MNKLNLAIALAALGVSAPSLAQAPAASGGRGGWQQDLTRQQAQQRADMIFQQLDLNHDGIVTRAEAQQAAAQMSQGGGGGRAERMIDRTFGEAQSLTQAQFEAQALARFDQQDSNHDGVLTAAERQQARAQYKPERG